MTPTDPAQRSQRFTASDAAKATRRARAAALEAQADALVATLYPKLRQAAERGLGKVERIIPPNISIHLRAAVVLSLRIDGYTVTEGQIGETIAWHRTADTLPMSIPQPPLGKEPR